MENEVPRKNSSREAAKSGGANGNKERGGIEGRGGAVARRQYKGAIKSRRARIRADMGHHLRLILSPFFQPCPDRPPSPTAPQDNRPEFDFSQQPAPCYQRHETSVVPSSRGAHREICRDRGEGISRSPSADRRITVSPFPQTRTCALRKSPPGIYVLSPRPRELRPRATRTVVYCVPRESPEEKSPAPNIRALEERNACYCAPGEHGA
ncbi:hypothetical protein KM043_002920 [Ampulex compressa]|nr:hypothetical protein KM043_002920 [Ampulex compressa]